MRRISNILTAVRFLGVSGFILVVSIAIVGWPAFSIIRLDKAIDQIYQEADKRIIVEDIEYYLLEQELAEKYFVLSRDRTEVDWYYDNETLAEIDKAIADLHTVVTLDSEKAAADELERRKEEYRQVFDEILTAGEAGNWDKVSRLQEISDEKRALMHEQVANFIFEIEMALEGGKHRANLRGREAILTGVISLIVFPFLAMWAFVVASRITQPVLTLTNAVVAIEGDQFRSDLLFDVIDRRDGLGRLAQALEHMAQEVKGREENLEQEVEELGEQLHEARRRKLLPTSRGRSTFDH